MVENDDFDRLEELGMPSMRTNQETTRNDQNTNALLNESFGPETQNVMPFGNEHEMGTLSPPSPLVPPESESG